MCSMGITVSAWIALGDALAAQGNAADASRAFRTAVLLDPNAQLAAGAGTQSRRLFEAARKKPWPKLRWGASTINGRVDPARVREAFASREAYMRVCYEEALGNNPSLQGRVAFRTVFGADGVGTDAVNAGSDVPDSALVSCMMRAAGGLVIPRPEGGLVTAVVPLMLQPR